MSELKTVVVLSGQIINVGEMENMPTGATVEQREMNYTEAFGWREIGFVPTLSEIDQLKISQAEQFETILELIGGV